MFSTHQPREIFHNCEHDCFFLLLIKTCTERQRYLCVAKQRLRPCAHAHGRSHMHCVLIALQKNLTQQFTVPVRSCWSGVNDERPPPRSVTLLSTHRYAHTTHIHMYAGLQIRTHHHHHHHHQHHHHHSLANGIDSLVGCLEVCHVHIRISAVPV